VLECFDGDGSGLPPHSAFHSPEATMKFMGASLCLAVVVIFGLFSSQTYKLPRLLPKMESPISPTSRIVSRFARCTRKSVARVLDSLVFFRAGSETHKAERVGGLGFFSLILFLCVLRWVR